MHSTNRDFLSAVQLSKVVNGLLHTFCSGLGGRIRSTSRYEANRCAPDQPKRGANVTKHVTKSRRLTLLFLSSELALHLVFLVASTDFDIKYAPLRILACLPHGIIAVLNLVVSSASKSAHRVSIPHVLGIWPCLLVGGPVGAFAIHIARTQTQDLWLEVVWADGSCSSSAISA